MSFRGGGTAGGSRNQKDAPQFVRIIPKFLQKYEHLLTDRKVVSEDLPQVEHPVLRQHVGGELQEEGGFLEELEGATIDEGGCGEFVEEAKTFSTALAEKEKGNKAYREKRYDDAIKHLNKAIKISSKDPVLYSNRSAALAAKKEYQSAKEDGEKAVNLNPRWPKAYSRLGAALFGLGNFKEAEEAYRKGLKEDAQNPTLLEGLELVHQKMRKMEAEAAANGKHVFSKRKSSHSRAGRSKVSKPEERGKRLLSFDEEEEKEEAE